jgi:hypothetical protein
MYLLVFAELPSAVPPMPDALGRVPGDGHPYPI